MATTLLSSVALAVGQQSNTVTVSESDEAVTLQLTAVQVGSASSQCRLVALDALGHVKATILINGSGTEQKTVEDIDSDLSCHVECLAGECRITLSQLSGTEKLGAGAGTVDTADLADGAIETAKLDDDAVTIDKVGDDAKGLGVTTTQAVADPGSTGTITPPATGSFNCTLDGGAGARTLADPAFDGQVCLLLGANSDAITVVPATGDYDGTNDTATFGAVADAIVLIGLKTEWRILANLDVALSAA